MFHNLINDLNINTNIFPVYLQKIQNDILFVLIKDKENYTADTERES